MKNNQNNQSNQKKSSTQNPTHQPLSHQIPSQKNKRDESSQTQRRAEKSKNF